MKRRRSRAPAREIKPGMLPCSFTVFFDGCCEPRNPGGTAGYGAAILEDLDKPPFHTISGMIEASPTTSNNIAEYKAVAAALEWFEQRGLADRTIHFFGDSRMVVCQLWGWPIIGKRWKIHGIDSDKPKGFYADLAAETRARLKRFRSCSGFWIPRAENSIADDLSKSHLRAAGVEFRIQPE